MPVPGVSVVIPTYNRAHLITETLQSVLAQTFRDFEIIVVDDGSTDNTKEALAPFLDKIRYVRQENRGVSAAWNRGIAEAKGDFVAFLASDDLWEPHALQRVMETFGKYPQAGSVSMMAREITADGARTEKIYGKRSPGEFFTSKSLLGPDGGGCAWSVVRREAIEKTGGYDESLRSAEDCDFFLRLSFHAPMVAVREPLLLRRAHGGNLSRDKLLNARCWLAILEKLARERPDFARRERWTYRREFGKELLRLGREILAHGEGGAASLAEARRLLARSIRTFPFFLRAYVYLAWSLLAPSVFRAWREREERRRMKPVKAESNPTER